MSRFDCNKVKDTQF